MPCIRNKYPWDVLRILGSEKKYRALLRRIAADPPFQISRSPANVKSAPFLLAYQVKPYAENKSSLPESSMDDTMLHHLANAEDVYVIDNANYGRMFNVNRAPPESDLEDFYIRLGSNYISKSVDRRFEVVGSPKSNTALTISLRERLRERGPLLVSPIITSRPLVSDAAFITDDRKLVFFEATSLLAVLYSLGKVSRRSTTTCFSRPNGQKHAIYITPDFDLFDVEHAIGDLILKRCMLEDAFFISSLLETPLEQLRARGFPVDRIVKSEPVVEVVPEKPNTPIPQVPTVVSMRDAQTSNTVPTRFGSTSPNSTNSDLNSTKDQKQKPAASTTSTSTAFIDDTPLASLTGSKADILLQMFPDADPSFIQAYLGQNPVDDVKDLAESKANRHYSKQTKTDDTVASSSVNNDDTDSMNELNASPSKQKSLRQRIGKVLLGDEVVVGLEVASHRFPRLYLVKD
jgi:hypothetical protein